MENDERMEVASVQRLHHAFNVVSVEFEFPAVFQVEVGVREADVCAIDDDIEGRKGGEELFEGIELLTSREGSVWSERRGERIRAMRSMV